MKTKVLFLLLATFTLMMNAQRGVRIGYIDMEYILENVDEYKEANTQLSAKVQKWKVEVEQQKNVVAQMKKDLNAEKVLLTKELIEEREEEIQILEKEMLEYQQARFGPQGDLVIQKRLLVQPVQDQVFNAVQEIASKRKYDFIFDKSADVVMLYSNKSYDISDLVLRSLNRSKKKNERNNRSKKSEKEKFEDTPPNPEVEARKQAVEAQRAERAKAQEEKRLQRLKEREELKKAYEERRKKLLEEREARKKAAQEAKDKKKQDQDKEEESDENENN
ncbi:OmpH family outer membrane protein [Ascidiimonas sp. W6]|uniref:OmpH family outer membrane protein n=1 Tax=Ascidiimonas meishanensis TaxID=3128903 RepID=UPI0030EE2DFD